MLIIKNLVVLGWVLCNIYICYKAQQDGYCQRNVFKWTAFVWNVGTEWGKLLRKQSSSLHNGSKNHFPDWQSMIELIDGRDHAYFFFIIEVYCITCSFLGSNSESRILFDYFITSIKNKCKINEWKFCRNASGLFMTALQCFHSHPKALMC
jgi:hypothetical protein